MPILDIERVLPAGEDPAPPGLAQALADAAAKDVFGSAPARTWVRLRGLPLDAYAENDSTVAPDQAPVFVTVLLARWPEGAALPAQVRALTETLAAVLGVAASRVHVQLAPPATGRQAFGGELVQ